MFSHAAIPSVVFSSLELYVPLWLIYPTAMRQGLPYLHRHETLSFNGAPLNTNTLCLFYPFTKLVSISRTALVFVAVTIERRVINISPFQPREPTSQWLEGRDVIRGNRETLSGFPLEQKVVSWERVHRVGRLSPVGQQRVALKTLLKKITSHDSDFGRLKKPSVNSLRPDWRNVFRV